MVRRARAYVTAEVLDEQASAWLAKIRTAVAPRPHLILDPDRCALIVVDMLNYFAAESGRAFLPAAPAIVPRIAALLAAWRRRRGSVVFTRHCHAGEQDLGMLGKFFSDYIRCGEPDAEILDTLAPLDDEPVVGKTTYDGFWRTTLEEILRARHVDQVLVTGVLTHMCCETTARAAFCRGFEVYIPVDATASSNELFHLASLRGLADSVAVIMATREVLEQCERRA